MHGGRTNGVGFAVGAAWVDDPMGKQACKHQYPCCANAGLEDSRAVSNKVKDHVV